MADRQQIYSEMLNLQQDQAAMRHFKDQIYDAIQELKDGKNNINNAINEFKKVYTGKAAEEKRKILNKKIEEINSVINELQESLGELNNKIRKLFKKYSSFSSFSSCSLRRTTS